MLSSADSTLIVRNLGARRRSRQILTRVSFDLRRGETLGVIGPNGAGKSTLLAALVGDLPFSGEVQLLGRSLHDWRAEDLATQRAVMSQSTHVPFAFTVREIVELGRLPFTESRADAARRVEWVLDSTELRALADRPYTALSGGEQRRVQFARLMAQADGIGDHAVLFVDEPTANLDLRHALTVLHQLTSRVRAGASALVVLHDMYLASRFCDRLVLLHDGELIACGTPEEVIEPALLERAFETPMHVHRTESGALLAHPVGPSPHHAESGPNRSSLAAFDSSHTTRPANTP